MNKFPQPPPDRRLNKNNNFIDEFKNSNMSNFSFKPKKYNIEIDKEDYEKHQNMYLLKIKHIEDMRNNILNYKLLNDKSMFLSNINHPNINKCNIILFGPSGSGKSSFIKTLYRAIYGTPFLPPDAMTKLVIKDTNENEGTLTFSRLHLKEESNDSSGIIICDTRGHICMNENEMEQFKIIIEGKVKEGVEISQNEKRSPLLLWEFWKKDSELFPKEIFDSKQLGLDCIPHNIVFVFDGSIDDIIDQNDEKFYRDLVNISDRKGYQSVHVILTRVDIFEKHSNDRNKMLGLSERNSITNTLKDKKIERVIDILGVKRSNIHFIENYHGNSEEDNVEIDHHALKTLTDIINSSEQFILNYISKNATCFAKCF